METGLLRDSDWAHLDGELCRVTRLTPMGWSKDVPYASIMLESPALAEPTMGFVLHKLDFEHLSEAFGLKDTEPDTEVLMIWTKHYLKRSAKLISKFMSRMWVMLCRENTYEFATDTTYKPEIDEVERLLTERRIAQWKPDVMK